MPSVASIPIVLPFRKCQGIANCTTTTASDIAIAIVIAATATATEGSAAATKPATKTAKKTTSTIAASRHSEGATNSRDGPSYDAKTARTESVAENLNQGQAQLLID